VAEVERLVVDEQPDDLPVGRVDDRLAELRIAVRSLRVRQRAELVERVEVRAGDAERLALVEVPAQPDVAVREREHRLRLAERLEVERGLAHRPRLDHERRLSHQCPVGGGGSCFSGVRLGTHSSHRGMYQFHSPSSFIALGSSTPRIIVASIRTARPSPTPSCFIMMMFSVPKIAKTATMMIAALVTVPAVRRMPSETASSVLRPRSRSSLMRLMMNTW